MNRRFYIAVALALTISACAPTPSTSTHEAVVVEQLFFGRYGSGQQVVSDSAWSNFLAEVVTPRFPDGFTVWPAAGQWRRSDGQIEHESSFVLELVHSSSATADSNVDVIISVYKKRFHQEAVLRVVIPAHVSY